MLSECATILRKYIFQVTKLLEKNHLKRIEHFQSNRANHAVFSSLILTVIFKVKLKAFYLSFEYFVNREIEQTFYCRQLGRRVSAMQWRHCECYKSWPYLHFLGHRIRNVNIWKTVRASEKCSIITFIDVDSRHYDCCTPWHWPTFSRSSIWNNNVS